MLKDDERKTITKHLCPKQNIKIANAPVSDNEGKNSGHDH